ncbi:MAG: hypothetical protein ABID87_08000 [Chloroflexota bacterium]
MEKDALRERLEKNLPADMVRFLCAAGKAAHERGVQLYLVGGVVRDLLLGRPNLDLDLVVEGDAIGLARQLARTRRGKVVTHPRFGTAKLQWRQGSVDLATARTETYRKPGALPTVQPGSLEEDLFRRDFTINALAVRLNPDGYGELLDRHGGEGDLEQKLIRVLHERSFIDDATRIWRGLRYEQRLDFRFEAGTLGLLKRDINMLDTVSGDRTRHELEMVLKEDLPEKVLRRADELGVLAKLHPSLKGDEWLAGKFVQARRVSAPGKTPPGLYLALLAYRLEAKEIRQLADYLHLPKSLRQVLHDTASLKGRLKSLEEPELKPSRICALLEGYQVLAITASQVATDSTMAAGYIMRYLKTLRNVKPRLTGRDLEALGLPPGPQTGEMLQKLRDARLNGKVKTRKDEEALVMARLRS